MGEQVVTRKLWGGFSGGKLHVDEIDDGFGGFGKGTRKAPALFTSKRAARARYEDVRLVEITYLEGFPI